MVSNSARSWLTGLAFVLAASALGAQSVALKIGTRDQLKVTVYGLEGMSGDFQVDADGTIKFPPLGLVKVGGLTARDVESAISTGLVAGGFAIRPPEVNVAVQPSASKSVTVTGEVKTPGTFTYSGEMTLYQALVKAGLPTATAGDQLLIVHDRVVAAGSAAPADAASDDIEIRSYKDMENGNRANDVTLRDGDRVFVKKAGQVYINGFVRNPNAYTIEPAGITLSQALTLAGGVTERGSDKRVDIVRKVPGKDPERLKNVTPNTIVKPGDTVTVKARIF
jgi:polysaccharide export outer membrane protein